MLKLRKYVKPFLIPILLIVGLLYGQAMCELTMPDYMSDIVNVGIHAGGIEDGVLDVVREDQANHLLIFMDEEEKEIFHDSYELVKSSKAEKNEIKKYPALKDENVYVLKKEKKGLKKALSQAESLVMVIDQVQNGKGDQKELEKMLSQFPEGVDLYQAMSMLPAEQIQSMKDEMNKNVKTIGESTLDTINAKFVQEEYKAIGWDMDAYQMHYLYMKGLQMLGIAILAALASVGVGFFASRVGAGFARDIRKDVFSKVESFSSGEFNHFSTNTLITRTTNDVQQVQMALVMVLRMVIYAPIIGIGAVTKVIHSNADMTWIIVLVIVVILSVMMTAFQFVMPKFKILQKLMDRLNGVVREMLDGMMVVRAFNNQKREEEKFKKSNTEIMKTNLFTARAMSSLMPIIMLVMNSATILIVWVGSHQVDSGFLQIGDMMAFMQYAMQIIMAFMMITMISIMLPRASVAAGRIDEILKVKPSICDPEKIEVAQPENKGMIEFKDVSFHYPQGQEDTLKHISFTAQAGKTTAFIGSTGSGKTTLVNLLLRFFDVTDGSILVNGVDVRNWSVHDLREKIGYVPQKGMLFSGTIASNLRYGKEDATQEELVQASEIAQAMEFISEDPDGFDRSIAQQGTNVSGGQRQRLSIARALVKQAEIYIFDDTFSALDFKTDAKVRKALHAMCQKDNSTVLMVAQRISTIMHADQIIVLDDGEIVGMGSHEELMKNCSVYQEIAYSQLSKEELADE